jgi:hypothetical protein
MGLVDNAQAQGTADPLWQATYWDNRYLVGPPVLQRPENSINYNWGDEEPSGLDIDEDTFSVRWVGFFPFRPATYRFTAVSDDGVRVWVDGDLIIDAWNDHPVQTITADKSLSAGNHQIVVEYYENEGGAVIQFWWAPAPPPDGNNWRGEYYNNIGLGGQPDLVREDPAINFNWDQLSPGPGINSDRFSVRWRQTVNLPAGNYRFRMTVDDGGRLWVNGRLLIDGWRVQSPRTYTGEIYLPGGPTPMRMEYFDDRLGALAQLSWSQAPAQTDQWRAEYYDGTRLAGAPVLVRNEPEINFNWEEGSPTPYQVGANRFSARWTRTVNLSPGFYRFAMTVDDGGRLWVNDQLIINAWRVQSPQTYTSEIYLSGRSTQIRMEYFENTGNAVAALSWRQTDGFTAGPLPTPTWQFPASAARPPGVEECLIYPRQNGRYVDSNLDPGFVQQCEQLLGEDAG